MSVVSRTCLLFFNLYSAMSHYSGPPGEARWATIVALLTVQTKIARQSSEKFRAASFSFATPSFLFETACQCSQWNLKRSFFFKNERFGIRLGLRRGWEWHKWGVCSWQRQRRKLCRWVKCLLWCVNVGKRAECKVSSAIGSVVLNTNSEWIYRFQSCERWGHLAPLLIQTETKAWLIKSFVYSFVWRFIAL